MLKVIKVSIKIHAIEMVPSPMTGREPFGQGRIAGAILNSAEAIIVVMMASVATHNRRL